MSAARNLGLGSARGEFITFLDADDVFLPRALEQMTSHLQEHPEAGAIRGRFQFWYSWTGDTHDLTRDFIPDVGLPPNTLFEPPALLSLTYPLGPALSPGVAAVMVRRPVVDRIGGFDAPFRGSGEDQVFYFKLHVKERLFVSDGCWFRYRQHPDSCCARARRTDDYTWWPLMLDWLERYLVQEGVGDVAVWKAVRSWRLLPYRHPALYRLGFKLARWAPITSFYRWLFWGPSQAMLCGKTQPSGSGATLPPAP
jgi:glycosyltransferase involved in cell wall biosynthesis